MLATTGAYQAMAESQELVPDFRVTITLPGGVYPDLTLGVKKLELNMSTVSDLPDQSRYQVGYTAAECTFTLAGLVDQRDESKSAAWLFGKYPVAASDGTVSPLYKQFVEMSPVTVDLGLQPAGTAGVSELLRKFTGYVSYYQENADGTVDFTCIDSRALFKSAVTTLPVVTAPPYNAGLTSEFAVDALLRAATKGTVSSWPTARPQCVLAVGFRSSLWAEVGSVDVASSGQPTPQFAPGAYGSALSGWTSSATTWGAPTYDVLGGLANSVYIEAFVSGIDTGTASWGFGNIAVTATSTGVTLNVSASSTPVVFTHAIGAGPHLVAAQMNYDGTTLVTGFVQIDAVQQAFSVGKGVGTWPIGTNRAGPSTLSGGATIAALQITGETAAVPSWPFTPRAVLNPSLNTLQVVPATDGDPWQVIQQIADAELAVAGFDEAGIFRFTNRATIRAQQSVRSITSAVALKAVGVESTAAAVINRAQIPYTLYKFASTASTLWTLDTATRVRRGSTITLIANVDGLFVNLNSTIAVLPNASADTANSYYRASNESAGITEHTGITFGAITQTAANQLTITVTNSSTRDAWLVSPANYTDVPAGTPLLRIAGVVVTASDQLAADYQYPPLSAGGAASTRWGEVAYQPGGNPWIQDPDTATTLAQDVVVDSCLPRPNLTGVSIVPDPRLQLIDVTRITDSDRTGVDEYARIFMWNISYEAGESGGDATYDMTLDARTLAAPGGWIMGVAGRSEIGSTAYVYPCI